MKVKTVTALAAELGYSRQSVWAWRRSGAPGADRAGYDVSLWRAWLNQRNADITIEQLADSVAGEHPVADRPRIREKIIREHNAFLQQVGTSKLQTTDRRTQ